MWKCITRKLIRQRLPGPQIWMRNLARSPLLSSFPTAFDPEPFPLFLSFFLFSLFFFFLFSFSRQIDFIFSDKTGTLTRNQMEFRKCSVAGVKYGLGFTDAARGAAKRLGKTLPPDHPVDSDDPFWNFYDPALLDNLTKGHETASFIREFLTFLAVCHTVIPERDKTNQNSESFFSSFFLLFLFSCPTNLSPF